MGFAPTSRDRLHRAPARGFEPMMRCICEVESTAVRRCGGIAIGCKSCCKGGMSRTMNHKVKRRGRGMNGRQLFQQSMWYVVSIHISQNVATRKNNAFMWVAFKVERSSPRFWPLCGWVSVLKTLLLIRLIESKDETRLGSDVARCFADLRR